MLHQEATVKVKETGITPEYLKNAPKAILSRGINERLFEDVWEDKLKSMITCPTYRGCGLFEVRQRLQQKRKAADAS